MGSIQREKLFFGRAGCILVLISSQRALIYVLLTAGQRVKDVGVENSMGVFIRKPKALSKVVEGNEHLHGIYFSTKANQLRLQVK